MRNLWRRLKGGGAVVALWIALCFGWTSAVYLSWLHRLIAIAGSAAADWLSMVAGYLAQALGLALTARFMRRGRPFRAGECFTAVTALLAAVSVPALLTDMAAGVIGFGFLMNLLCGMLSALYLYAAARNVDARHRSMAFGGGYALATVAVGLLALIGRGSFLHSNHALLLYLPLGALLAAVTPRLRLLESGQTETGAEGEKPQRLSDKELAVACGVTVLISAVKNLGYSFPSAEIGAGLVPELTRLPYAVGLTAAAFIHDRNRKHGMVCTIAALIMPFIMLGLTSEPMPATICWGLDYLFYGFFSVFRAVLFLDIASRTRRWELAPMGLLAGRVGDALGTAVGLLLAEHRLWLILVATAAFFPTVFLFFREYQRQYEPETVRQRSEQEVFESFCLRYDLSSREREVVRMVLDGHPNGEIAEALFITESTVKYHVRNVLQKVGCKNRAELQRIYKLALYPEMAQEALPKIG